VNSVSINSVAATAPAATGSVPDSERPHHHNQQMQPQAGANAPRDPTLQSQCSSCGRRMEDHVTDPVTGHVHAPHQHHHSVTDVPAPAAAAATADVSTQLVATDSAAPASSTASSTAVTSVVSRAVTSPVDSLTVAAVDSINRAQLHNHASSYGMLADRPSHCAAVFITHDFVSRSHRLMLCSSEPICDAGVSKQRPR